MGSRAAEGRGRRAKLAGAIGLLGRRPRDLLDVAVDHADRAREPLRPRAAGPQRPLEDVLVGASRALGGDLTAYLREDAAAKLESMVLDRMAGLGPELPFPLEYNAAPSLTKLCYALTRALRPAAVLETGVAYGMSSAFTCKALAVNRRGELHSVDRAPVRPDAEDYVGALVPEELRSRWTLHRGKSRRVLPGLLSELGQISIFVHDSWHTYRNISWELRTITPHLARPAAVLVDDAIANRAFEEWAAQARPAFSAVVAGEPVGVAVFTRAPHGGGERGANPDAALSPRWPAA